MAQEGIFTEDFKEQPYWWDRAPLQQVSPPPPLPAQADVVIVGSGYTGITAALYLARSGADTVVIDAEAVGYGASRRNAGFLGRVLKRDVAWLEKHHGEDHALRVYRELNEAFETVKEVVTTEQIEAYLRICGRFIGATSPTHYELLAKELETNKRKLGIDYHMVPRGGQHSEIASDIYYGGAIIPDLGSIHPGLYHKGLVDRATSAGVKLVPHTAVTAVRQAGSAPSRRFQVETSRGVIEAANVIEATNGYTHRNLAWLARRVIPFQGYMIATEILPTALIDRLLPHRRTYLQTNMNINFIRPAPDTERILMGGLTGSRTPSLRHIAADLRTILRRILPGIGDVKLSHVWTGQCAGTFDFMPHIGGEDGHYYGIGYNFAGIPMGTYFGRKLAYKVLGRPEGSTVFETQPLRSMPLYTGNPWFVPLAMKYFDLHDWWIGRGAPGRSKAA
ncbi:NAD(P)/FAD-dependent oxidoreductase [Rhodoligotrophos defluvii]|uniref:NAD(P)/FAD-dependent oxidoreductase n=1 Tax=Rhodoligotrophos defluvii TaxID=2561934 RepID=UPI0010C93732|nr:FAD-binding oxidoreductase [Rhodoligotrophos defluvii]